MSLCLGGLKIERIFASEIWGAYFWEGLNIIIICLFYYYFFGGEGGSCYRNFMV